MGLCSHSGLTKTWQSSDTLREFHLEAPSPMSQSAPVPTRDPVLLGKGRHLALVRSGGCEWVERTVSKGVVIVVAITDDDELILIEQFRGAVGRRVVELPAGLVGDLPGTEDEDFAAAGGRELLEETGYRAGKLERLIEAPSSAGTSNEIFNIFSATQLEKVGPGGGEEGEDLTVHLVPLASLMSWLEERRVDGALIDTAIFAGLFLAGATSALGSTRFGG